MKLDKQFFFMIDKGDSFPEYDKQKTSSRFYGFKNSMKPTRKHVLLSGDIFNKRTVYKYIDRRKALSFVNGNTVTLRFVQPSEWKDPYEKRFYNADYNYFANSPVIAGKHTKVLALCVASERDSEPSWRMYIDCSPKLQGDPVCIQYKLDFKALLDFLNYYIETEGKGEYKLIVGSVFYQDKVIINKMHKLDENNVFECSYFKNFNFENYINLLRTKRKAFKYESEIRLFLVPSSNIDNLPKELIIPVPNVCPTTVPKNKRWRNIITQVILDPDSSEGNLDYYKSNFNGKLGLSEDDIVHSDLLSDISIITIGEKNVKP